MNSFSGHHRGMTKLRIILPLLLLAACGNPNKGETIRIAAAASLADAIGGVATDYGNMTGRPMETDFGASGTLARQIADGAPADVYVSANKKWVEYLQQKDLVEGSPVVIARNRLVCVVRSDSKLEYKDFESLAAQAPLIAVGDEGVPAGEYTRQALTKAGVLDRLSKQLVGQQDVRSVVEAVESGDLPVGFVYASDAYQFSETLRVAFLVDVGLHDPIEYYAVLLKQARHPDAARGFVLYLQSEKAEKQFAKLGFVEH